MKFEMNEEGMKALQQQLKTQLQPVFAEAIAAASQKTTLDEKVAAYATVLRAHGVQPNEQKIREDLSEEQSER